MKNTKFIRKWKSTEKPTEQAKAVSNWLNSVKDNSVASATRAGNMGNKMNIIGSEFKEEQFKSYKDYLVAMAVLYIRKHTGYIGMDDRIFFNDAQCDGYSLADDLVSEFDLEEIIGD